MPSLGADMEAGTVSQWLVKPGDEVHRGQVVAVVETEKSTIEVEIFESGVVDELLVSEGERVPVGTALAHVTEAQRPVSHPSSPTSGRAPAPRPEGLEGRITLPPTVSARHRPTVHSPVVRQLAEKLGIDVAALEGSGPGGTVTRADVEQAATVREAVAPGPGRSAPMRGSGKAAGRRRLEPGTSPKPSTADRTPSSPLARQLAAEMGLDLSTVVGTGPGGSVLEQDVRLAARGLRKRAAGEQAIPAATAASDRQAAMRQAIGALMARSKREIPHYYLSTTIDVSAASAWVEQANLERPVADRLVLSVLLLKASARAVARVPEMNGYFMNGAFVPSEAIHVGVAISLRSGGVIAPAIHDAERLSLDDLMAQLHDLVGRARTGVLRSSEMSDPTITVTNLGELGVETVFGVIYPPQVALVGFGRVSERPVAREGMLGVRSCVTATLSADHRASDGHRGGRFLAEIDRLLQEPEKL
jgi:pyruvate dehydrogenase E2 component (dihydrolipoamide acetyltransferase)